MPYDLLYGPSQTNLREGGRYPTYADALAAAGALPPHPWVEVDEVLDERSRRTVIAWPNGVDRQPVTFLGNPPEQEIPLAPAGPRSRPSALSERALA